MLHQHCYAVNAVTKFKEMIILLPCPRILMSHFDERYDCLPKGFKPQFVSAAALSAYTQYFSSYQLNQKQHGNNNLLTMKLEEERIFIFREEFLLLPIPKNPYQDSITFSLCSLFLYCPSPHIHSN